MTKRAKRERQRERERDGKVFFISAKRLDASFTELRLT